MTGWEFKRHRKSLRLKQDELAILLGVSRQTVSRIEDKQFVPELYSLAIQRLVLGNIVADAAA